MRTFRLSESDNKHAPLFLSIADDFIKDVFIERKNAEPNFVETKDGKQIIFEEEIDALHCDSHELVAGLYK